MLLLAIYALSSHQNSDPFVKFSGRDKGTFTMSDPEKRLRITLDTNGRCALSSIVVNGHEVATEQAAFSGIKVGDNWFTTENGIPRPSVSTNRGGLTVTGIRFGGGGVNVEESWRFVRDGSAIQWRIDRTYLSGGVISDSGSPAFHFHDMKTWTGALLGTGGVAWCKLFDAPNASYGVHTNSAEFWNDGNDSSLDISSSQGIGRPMALRFTREPSNEFSLVFEPSPHRLLSKHGQARYLHAAQDVWTPWQANRFDSTSVTYTLRAKPYSQTRNPGDLKGIDGKSVKEILNTIGRIGVIDDKIIGSNGWYSGYAVYHEPWVAMMGLAIDDPRFTANMSAALDYERENGIEPDGLVKSRWTYDAGDSEPGTYDPTGFYECQWGRLMDSQTSYALNVSQQFDLNGDVDWLRRQKSACESAIDYLLRRDTTGDHLVKMATDTWKQHKSSDWLDITWASYESAFVNAQLYHALSEWSENEEILGDHRKAAYYRDFAAKLKVSFNKPIANGGFWDPKNMWYAYWREKDGSIYGDNLVLPINLMPIAYGLCDDLARKAAILTHVEKKMSEEKLFCWPVNIYPYRAFETGNPRFPDYENGDIFLAWAEVGIQSYAGYDVKTAVKYLKRILDQYKKDGLAFQRYLRVSQRGAGDDILANNCNAVVGLYRDIYGIHPKYNRLYLAPRIDADLSGSRVNYSLRDQPLSIMLTTRGSTVRSEGSTVQCSEDFGVNFTRRGLEFFMRDESKPALTIERTSSGPLDLRVESWGKVKRWSLSSSRRNRTIKQTLHGLTPGRRYRIHDGGSLSIADNQGNATFLVAIKVGKPAEFEVKLGS